MTTKLEIRTCPSCGGRIKRVRKKWQGTADGRKYSVPSLEFYECPNCGEKVYDAAAMQRIEAASPALKVSRHAATA